MTESKFTPGKSGNPKGRPKNKAAPILLRKAISDAMPGIIQSLIAAALNGDVGAATTLLNRCVPTLKAEAQTITLSLKDTPSEQGNVIIKATITGQIPPDIGSQLITALASQSKIVEIDDVLKRLGVLETILEAKK